MVIRSPRARRGVALLSVGLILAGCGASPTDSAAGGGEDGDAALQEVYDAVDGLTGQERFDALLEMAEEEADQGPFGFYHSGTFTAEIEAFQELTGLEVGDFEATSERVAERVVSENEAGRPGSSVVLGGADDMSNLMLAGGLSELETVTRDTVGEDFQGDGWVSPIAIMEMPAYNSDAVSPEDLPETWEDFFTNFGGRIGIELTDWSWYASLVQSYFVEQQGMTEDEAIAFVTEGLRGASTVDGHTLTANLLASGQFDYVPNVFAHYVPDLQESGAPISYEGLSPDMPPFVVALGAGLTADNTHPASGLLFLEYLMSAEGQELIAARDYVPTADTYTGETLLDQYPNAIPDRVGIDEGEDIVAVQELWKQRFDELLRAAGTTQVDE